MAVGAGFLAANAVGGVLRADHALTANIILTLGIVAAWAWLTAVAMRLYRSAVDRPAGAAAR